MGQRPTPSPHASLAVLALKKERLQEELRTVEKQVYDLETSYLNESSLFGNVLKGFDGFLSTSKSSAHLRRPRKFGPDDRLFTLSSVTAPSALGEEALASRGENTAADGSALQGGRSKITGLPTVNTIGKQKRGRTAAPREGKRIKQPNELDVDEEELVDLVPRELV